MDTGLLLAICALAVAGLASVLGIWMERDQARPPRWAVGLSVLIVVATVVSVFQSIADSRAAAQLEEDMARMLQRLDTIASNSSNPELDGFLDEEFKAQSRSNPGVISRVVARAEAEGKSSAALLGRHLGASELPPGVDHEEARAAGQEDSSRELERLSGELEATQAKIDELTKKLESSEQGQTRLAEEKQEAESQIQQLKKELDRVRATATVPWQKG